MFGVVLELGFLQMLLLLLRRRRKNEDPTHVGRPICCCRNVNLGEGDHHLSELEGNPTPTRQLASCDEDIVDSFNGPGAEHPEMFKAMDTDNSGAITFDELKAGLRRYGSTLKDTEAAQGWFEKIWINP
ncbi:hypothetical protein K1719_020259 [Acacia pycnantha]|nr:hypothetical protein K1719_020259 [Acacia pycnantha]